MQLESLDAPWSAERDAWHAPRPNKQTHKSFPSLFLAVALVLLFLPITGIAGFAAITILPTHVPAVMPVTSPNPHVKHYYLALGDSLAFGFQPDLNWDQGYAEQWWYDLQHSGSRAIVDYGCNDVTTGEFINMSCPISHIEHDYFKGSELHAALAFIKQHPGQVGPVSLDLGANDVLGDIQPQTCSSDGYLREDLESMDANLTFVILPKLLAALKANGDLPSTQLVMMNYYNPYQTACPAKSDFVQTLNRHLAADAALYHVPVVNVYQAFGGSAGQAQGVCKYTWMCAWPLRDIHPNSAGYAAIAKAFEKTVGY